MKGWGFGLGVAFGRGHAQKHNQYISEAVFVGKYRHSKGRWLWDQWVRTAQHSTKAILWLCRWAQVGLDWICREWVWNTVDLQLSRMWWSREGVYSRLWSGKDVAPATPMKKEAWPWISKTTRDTAMALIHWCDDFCFAGSPLKCLWRLYGFGSAIRVLRMIGLLGWEVWIGMAEGNRGDVGTKRDLKCGSRMTKRMAVKGRAGHGP